MPREKITPKTCLSCGACCVSLREQDAYCDVTSEDEKRLGKKFVRLNVLYPRPFDVLLAAVDGQRLVYGAIKTKWVEQKSGPFKGVSTCQCAALKGAIFKNVRCSVYEMRPHVCHVAVKPGDKWCREIRHLLREQLETLETMN
jgi:Fe-S-cluster containining protein